MGARWMQQKLLKMRKMRRAYLKPYSMHAGNKKPPNKDVLKEYKDRAKSMEPSAHKDYLEGLFPGAYHSNSDAQAALRQQHPRAQAQKRKDDLAKEISQERKIILNRRLTVFFEPNDGPAYFVECNVKHNYIMKSKVYSSLSEAKAMFQADVIVWESCETLIN